MWVWNISLKYSHYCERPGNCLSKNREIFECFLRHLSFWVSGVKSPLIFYAKKKKKKKKEKLNTKYMIKILHCHWLNKDIYNLGKLNLTMLWVLLTIYVKEYKAFVPSYNLPKIKKIRH